MNDLATKKEIKIGDVNPSVFTFTTATEDQIAMDVFYAILKTNDDYDEWVLFPHLLERKEIQEYGVLIELEDKTVPLNDKV